MFWYIAKEGMFMEYLTLKKLYDILVKNDSIWAGEKLIHREFIELFFPNFYEIKGRTRISDIMNGKGYIVDAKGELITPKAGLKKTLWSITAEIQRDDADLRHYTDQYVSCAVNEHICNDSARVQKLIRSIISTNKDNMPKALWLFLNTISKQDHVYCLAWLLVLALVGPESIKLLSDSWVSIKAFEETTECQNFDKSKFLGEYPPDGKMYPLGATVTHTWVLKNVGTETWYSRYCKCFQEGTFGYKYNELRIDLPEVVKPGETCEVTINMITPDDEGNYLFEWKMYDSNDHVCFPKSTPLGLHLVVTMD